MPIVTTSGVGSTSIRFDKMRTPSSSSISAMFRSPPCSGFLRTTVVEYPMPLPLGSTHCKSAEPQCGQDTRG